MSEIYARDHQMPASPTLCQSQSLDPDDIFALTSAQPHESVAPYAQSGQYRSPTVSDESDVEIDTITESEVETDTITPSARSGQYRSPTVSDESVESSNVSHTPRAPANHPAYHLIPFKSLASS
ncbi:hypothetical protein E4U58_001190, partial [Claviceps cyperi]